MVIEYAGASCSCSLVSCNDVKFWEGAVLVTSYPDGGQAFITNSTFRHIAGHGMVEGWGFPNGDPRNEQIDFQPTNAFDDLKGCVQTLPSNTTAGGCPTHFVAYSARRPLRAATGASSVQTSSACFAQTWMN